MPLMYIPVEIGKTVWKTNIGCCNICMKTSDSKIREGIGCVPNAVCFTRYKEPVPIEFSFDNIQDVFLKWNTEIFATKQEAIKATKEKVEKHKKELEALGVEFRPNGEVKRINDEYV